MQVPTQLKVPKEQYLSLVLTSWTGLQIALTSTLSRMPGAMYSRRWTHERTGGLLITKQSWRKNGKAWDWYIWRHWLIAWIAESRMWLLPRVVQLTSDVYGSCCCTDSEGVQMKQNQPKHKTICPETAHILAALASSHDKCKHYMKIKVWLKSLLEIQSGYGNLAQYFQIIQIPAHR